MTNFSAQPRHQVNGLQDIGFALGIIPEKQVKARAKVRIQPRVIAEVSKAQVGQMHGISMSGGGLRSEIF